MASMIMRVSMRSTCNSSTTSLMPSSVARRWNCRSTTSRRARARRVGVYASALTTILLDNHNYIPTTDNRLLRRIIRDYKYRGVSAQETIHRWPSVRAGENKWIFPFQENADAMLNTQAEPLLQQVPDNCEEYAEAYRLLKFLKYFKGIPYNNLPPTSLLREFLGGSSFHY